MKEYPVGYTVKLRIVPSEDTCKGCFFDELQRNLYDDICYAIKCSREDRVDHYNVKFVETDDE